MTSSLSDLVGQPLTWFQIGSLKTCYKLYAPDKSVIATYPTERSGGWFGERWKEAKALVPDGTGTLFLYREDKGVVAISAVEQGPRLATFDGRALEFPDGRGWLIWDHIKRGWLEHDQRVWRDRTETTTYVRFSQEGWTRTVHVEIYPPAAEIPELSLLLVLGIDTMHHEWRQAAIDNGNIGFHGPIN